MSRPRPWLLLFWMACLHAAALYLFTTGFFLTRFEVKDVSQCHQVPHVLSKLRGTAETRESPGRRHGCWMQPRFRRVVFVVVDALRYDFIASDESTAKTSVDTTPSFFLHHLPVFNQTLTDRPEHSLLLKFVADPPTMTMQRLKGLTTGGLPTFLDIKDNMGSSNAIAEDNWIHQMKRQDRPMVFMGDDTWLSLYDSYFTRTYAYDSFNVKDLDTVDNGVKEHLFPELQESDWDLLIAHFLGVDHVGHTHGPSSIFMTKKLDETNAAFVKLLDELPDDDETLLVVLGDHGMSADGNHGGATDEETGAALFLYSKKPLHSSRDSIRWPKEVPQVDLVPTLALLTGLPIPFGNLGTLIPQLFYVEGEGESALDRLTKALQLNVDQVRRYLFTYSAASKLPTEAYADLEDLYARLDTLRQQVEETQESLERQERQTELVERQQEYVREALALGRSIWTQFDFVSMTWGILLLLSSLPLLYVSTDTALTGISRSLIPTAVAFVGGLCVPHLDRLLLIVPSSPLSRGLALASLVTLLHVSFYSTYSIVKRLHIQASDAVAFVTVVLHLLSLLSNSYIVAEASTLDFLVMTVGAFFIWKAQRLQLQRRRALVYSIAFVLTTRVLQSLESPNIIHSMSSSFYSLGPLVVLSFAAIYLLVSHSWSTKTLLLSSGVVYSCVCCGLYWLWSPIPMTLLRLWIPRTVYLVTLTSCISFLRSCKTDRLRHLLLLQVSVPLMLVLGPRSSPVIAGLMIQGYSFVSMMRLCQSLWSPSWVLLWCLVMSRAFSLTGHEATFTSLQNAAGFVGFDEFNFYAAGALLALNTFGSYVLLLGMMPLGGANYQSWAWTTVGYYAAHAAVSTVFVAAQRRHLMVWAIFAPKFLFDAITLLVVDTLLVLMS